MNATELQGWRWLPGMMRLRWAPGFRDHLKKEGRVPEGLDDWNYEAWPVVPDSDDPATAGCLLHLAGCPPVFYNCDVGWSLSYCKEVGEDIVDVEAVAPTLGRACFALATDIGRWPGVLKDPASAEPPPEKEPAPVEVSVVYLFAKKWRGAINIASMRYFKDLASLEAHVRQHPPEHWSGGESWHAYRVCDDGSEAKSLTPKEASAIGLR